MVERPPVRLSVRLTLMVPADPASHGCVPIEMCKISGLGLDIANSS
jgi:hypothetical protein